MSKALKTQAKIAQGHKITDLVPHPARTSGGTARNRPTPPFAAHPGRPARDPRGGLPAPVSLPLPVTPRSLSEGKGGKK